MFTGGCGAGWKDDSWELSPDPEKNICRFPICGILALEAANRWLCCSSDGTCGTDESRFERLKGSSAS
jgi:hypothetical protein